MAGTERGGGAATQQAAARRSGRGVPPSAPDECSERVTLPAPPGLRATPVPVADTNAGAEIMILSYPLPSLHLPDGLTDAERAVADAMLEGLSNAEIAEHRGTSMRTIANQVASVFRKLGVQSRAELQRLVLQLAPDAEA